MHLNHRCLPINACSPAADWGFRPLSLLWSLAIEEQFYLLMPLIMRAVSPTRTLQLVLATIALAPLSRALLLALGAPPLTVSLLPLSRMDSIGLGILVAWIVRNQPARAWCAGHRGPLAAWLGFLAIGCAGLVKLRAGNGGFVMAAGGYTIVAGFFATVLLLLETQPATRFHRLLSLSGPVLLGRYSYFLYLFQGLAVGLIASLAFERRWAVASLDHWTLATVGLAGMLLVAALSWRYFEAPLISLGHRWAYAQSTDN
jgi:peptidoglycan/LPS O-acetylase OafA/YrhL